MSNPLTQEELLEKYHPSDCDKYETLRGKYPNDRRLTGKDCSCGFDKAVAQRDKQVANEARIKAYKDIDELPNLDAKVKHVIFNRIAGIERENAR